MGVGLSKEAEEKIDQKRRGDDHSTDEEDEKGFVAGAIRLECEAIFKIFEFQQGKEGREDIGDTKEVLAKT